VPAESVIAVPPPPSRARHRLSRAVSEHGGHSPRL